MIACYNVSIMKTTKKTMGKITPKLTEKAMMGAYNNAMKKGKLGVGFGGEKSTTKKRK